MNLETSLQVTGKVISVMGGSIHAKIPLVGVGDFCFIEDRNKRIVPCEVVSLRNESVILSSFESCTSVSIDDSVFSTCKKLSINIPQDPLNKVLDSLGNPFLTSEHKTEENLTETKINSSPINPLNRRIISKQVETGICSIDSMIPLGEGQRIGLFASAGVGKSTLLTSLAKNVDCDICVIALIGERGREVTEFLSDLGPKGREKSVLVVSTSDELPMKRMMAAYTAMAIAEKYRDKGKSVLLLMDSLTRFARSVRDVALTAGQLPVRQGYPSDVYQKLPELIERAGNSDVGSITAVYTVLTNPDGTEDPLADEIKSLLDGHIYLSQKIANQGIRPAIDIEKSISRLSTRLLSNEQLKLQSKFRNIFCRWKNDREIVLLGGSPDAELEKIILYSSKIVGFLSQTPEEHYSGGATWEELGGLIKCLF